MPSMSQRANEKASKDMSEKVPPDKLCACGHRAFWYEVEEDPDTSPVLPNFGRLGTI